MLEKKPFNLIQNWSKMKKTNIKETVNDWYLPQVENNLILGSIILQHNQDKKDYLEYHKSGACFLKEKRIYREFDTFKRTNNLSYSDIYWIFPWDQIEDFEEGQSILNIMSEHFDKKMSKLKEEMNKNQVHCDFNQYFVDFSNPNPDLIKAIREKNPKTIHWSNIPDYFNTSDFLDLANKMSTCETIHSFHLMNWIIKVYGASLLDYQDRLNDQEMDKMFKNLQHEYYSSQRDKLNKISFEWII